MYNMSVLDKLKGGEIFVNKAISMIERPPKPRPLPKGNILIIKIQGQGKDIFVPIPLFLINLAFLLCKLGLKIASKFRDSEDLKEVVDILKHIKYRDMRKLVYSLRICKSTGLVEIHNGDNKVIIDVI